MITIIPRRPPDPERRELTLAPYEGGWQVWDRASYRGWVGEAANGLWSAQRRRSGGWLRGRYPTRADAARALAEVTG